jgi:hypothetical protein
VRFSQRPAKLSVYGSLDAHSGMPGSILLGASRRAGRREEGVKLSQRPAISPLDRLDAHSGMPSSIYEKPAKIIRFTAALNHSISLGNLGYF